MSACVRNQSLDLTLVFEYIDQDLTTYMNCAENGLSRGKIKVRLLEEKVLQAFTRFLFFVLL